MSTRWAGTPSRNSRYQCQWRTWTSPGEYLVRCLIICIHCSKSSFKLTIRSGHERRPSSSEQGGVLVWCKCITGDFSAQLFWLLFDHQPCVVGTLCGRRQSDEQCLNIYFQLLLPPFSYVWRRLPRSRSCRRKRLRFPCRGLIARRRSASVLGTKNPRGRGCQSRDVEWRWIIIYQSHTQGPRMPAT